MVAGAGFGRVEEAEAAGRAQADGTEAEPCPEALRSRVFPATAPRLHLNTVRAIRSLFGRGRDFRDMTHAASRAEGAALRINWRIARLLKVKVINAEAL